MLRSYFKIALRNLLKNSVYSAINIGGLSIGLACSMLILLWVSNELSYDKFHTNAHQIHQLWVNATYDGKVNSYESVPIPVKDALKTEDSRIKNTALGGWGTIHLLSVGEARLNIRGNIVSEEFLDIFQFPMVRGSSETALDDPRSIVLTETTAKALFGDKNPLGEIILVDNKTEVNVTGVLQDLPENSSLQFEFLLPFNLFESEGWVRESIGDWGDYSWQVYVELQPGVDKAEVEETIKGLLTKNGQVDVQRELFLHPLLHWRLHSSFKNGKEAGGMIDYVLGFTLIAIFILVIACINFMNLATARSEGRAREVGIRKSIGSMRSDLIFQFMGESVLIATISFILALTLVELSLPLYNTLVNKTLFIHYSDRLFWVFAIGIVLVTGIFSGSYPALYLSSFQPVKVLKGKIKVSRSAATPRQILVVLQFVFAIALIIGTLVISQQIQHTKSRQLGYDQENLITVWHNQDIGKNYQTIKQELLATGVVHSVTKSNSPITEVFSHNFLDWPGKPADQKVAFSTIATEYDYTKTMGIKILEGRDFSPDFPSDSSAVLINKAAWEVMGIKDILGTTVTFFGERTGTVVGVIDNVVMQSPNSPINPSFTIFQPDWVSAVSIRMEKTSDLQASLKKVEAVFKKFDPLHPFTYTFVDEQYAKKFTTITMINNIANLFAFLAILITSLGLFGLAAFTAEQRTKEIGIRKVMGASITSLVTLITKEFTGLVIIAFLIAAPISWWGLSTFLERYTYRIDFPWWVVGIAGGIALVFALSIVSFQALKAALANPVNSLRNE